MVAWAKDFDRRYPVRGWPRKGLDTVTWWLLRGVDGVLEIEETSDGNQEASKEAETQNHGASIR